MANVKVNDLPELATTPLATDLFVVQDMSGGGDGVTKKVTAGQTGVWTYVDEDSFSVAAGNTLIIYTIPCVPGDVFSVQLNIIEITATSGAEVSISQQSGGITQGLYYPQRVNSDGTITITESLFNAESFLFLTNQAPAEATNFFVRIINDSGSGACEGYYTLTVTRTPAYVAP